MIIITVTNILIVVIIKKSNLQHFLFNFSKSGFFI